MSYTYIYVLIPAATPYEEIATAVAAAAPMFAGAYSDAAVAILRPTERITVLELHDRRSQIAIEGAPATHDLPAQFRCMQPFLLELAWKLSARVPLSLAAFVTDLTDGFEVVELAPRRRGAVRSQFGGCMPFQRGPGEFTWDGSTANPNPNAEKEAAVILSAAVGEQFADVIDYLHWYAAWFDGWFDDHWREVDYGSPLQLISHDGTRLPEPRKQPWLDYWAAYFGES